MFDCGGLIGNEQPFTTQLSQEQSPRLRDIRSVFLDQIAFSNTETVQTKKAFRHSVLPLYIPLYVLHGERRHIKVMELFSNWHDTVLFRPLHKQPDFQRCSKLIVWRAWNSSTSFKKLPIKPTWSKVAQKPWQGEKVVSATPHQCWFVGEINFLNSLLLQLRCATSCLSKMWFNPVKLGWFRSQHLQMREEVHFPSFIVMPPLFS